MESLDIKRISHQSSNPILEKEIKLSEEEAESLANNLKIQLKKGLIPKEDEHLISLIVAGLGDKRGFLRRTFSKTLADIGNKATPLLVNALHNHSSVTVRRAAAKTLRLIKDPSALNDLLKALTTDKDPVVQGSSVAAMAVFGEEAVELLFEVFNKPESTTIQTGLASWGIAFIGEKAPNTIKKAAISKNKQTRAAAIAALGDQIYNFDDIEARKIVINALNDDSPEVRSEAAVLIGKTNEKEWGQPFLIKKLNDSDNSVRKNAALALMRLESTNSLTALRLQSKQEKNKNVLKIINLAINQIEKINTT